MQKTTFWDQFTAEGRLKNAWNQALGATDPVASVAQLRNVGQKLLGNPSAYVHLWLPFLDTFLDDTRLRILLTADLETLEIMANSIPAAASPPLRSEDIWTRLLAAYTKRGEEHQARRILVRIYSSPTATWEEMVRSARELALRRCIEPEYLTIYVDFLLKTSSPALETPMLSLLASVFRVHFDTDRTTLLTVGKLARQLATHRIPIPVAGLWTTFGLYKLLLELDPVEASACFRKGWKANQKDRTALIGLLSSLIRQGTFQAVEEICREPAFAEYFHDEIVVGLLQFNACLWWLESADRPGATPKETSEIERLKGLGLQKSLGDLVDLTFGRVYLLLGDVQRARAILRPLLEKQTRYPQVSYYLACAEVYAGDAEGVARCFNSMTTWSARWTVACLLLDADPELAERCGVTGFFKTTVPTTTRSAYLPFIEARLALVQATCPSEIVWKSQPGTIEEELEALRTTLGYLYFVKKMADMQQLLAHPLFLRFSRIDQLFWQGLRCLLVAEQVQQGITFLEQALSLSGYWRAALVLAIYFLKNQKLVEAKRYLAKVATTRKDGKVILLHAFIAARERQVDVALKQAEQLVKQPQPRIQALALFAQGTLLLQQAANSLMNGQPEQASRSRSQAAIALQRALQKGEHYLPPYAEMLAHSAQFIANPQERPALSSLLWSDLEGLGASKPLPWLKWVATFARVWYGNASEVAGIAGELRAIIAMTPRLEQRVVEAIALAFSNVPARLKMVRESDIMLSLLEEFAAQSTLAPVKRSCQQGITRSLLARYQQAEAPQRNHIRQELMQRVERDLANGLLAFLLACISVENAATRAAINVLSKAQPEDNRQQIVFSSFLNLLDGRQLPLKDAPRPEPGASSKLQLAYELLRIAIAFAAKRLDEGYEGLTQMLRQSQQDAQSYVKMERLLPLLCAYHTKTGSVPAVITDTLHRLSRGQVDVEQASLLANCAAAIGEYETACSLWQKAIALEPGTGRKTYRQDYAKLLCHLAVVAKRADDDLEAIRKLRQAAVVLEESVVR